VPDEQTRAALFESELLALPHRFRDVGYHTVEVQPAMNVEWAEGKAFYGIDESIWQEQLDYSGPRYDFGHMPDQFSLHYLLKNVVEPAEKPLFTLFIGVSSHAPWSLIPPYIPDWQIDSESFAHATAKRHEIGYGTMLRSPAALPAYFDAIEYSLRTAFDFARRLPRASLVIVVGDHQPPIATSITPSDYTHEVPIHVISNRMDLVARCRVLGFVDGLDVPDTFPSFPMSEVAPALLRTFSK
jgi:hypothetical protein